MDKKASTPTLNKVKNRLLILSPTVKSGLERECNKTDFNQEGGRPIGKGGFGEVWKVTQKQTKRVYVIKVMSKKSIIEQKLVDQINREIEIMYKVNHPHIVKLINHFEDDESFYLIMDYASKGQLYSLLKKQLRFDEKTAAQYIIELISAIKYLHSFDPPIIHRDVKPENILLDENYRVKLADFGWSNYNNKSGDLRKTYCGTPEYLSPEMLRKQGHDTNIDIWSIGILIFELLAGHSPFGGTSQEELFYNIKKQRIMWPSDFPPDAKDLVFHILKQNPKDRVSIAEINSHKWFSQIPGLKPVLVALENDQKSLVESHLVLSVKPGEESSPKKMSKYQFDNMQKKASVDKDISEFNQKNDEIDILIKEIRELRLKLDKSEMQVKKLSSELSTYKEKEEYWVILGKENRKLNQEIEGYKVLDQNREDLLSELDNKNLKLEENLIAIEIKNDEISKNKKQICVYEQKLHNNNLLFKQLETANFELKLQIDELKSKKESNNNNFDNSVTAKMKEKLKNDSMSGCDDIDDNKKFEEIYSVLHELIMQVKELSTSYSINLSCILETLVYNKEEITNSLEINNEMLKSLLQNDKQHFEEEYNIMINKLTSEINKNKTSHTNKNIEELKKQLIALMPFKLKNIELEAKIEQCENTININNEKIKNLIEHKNAMDIWKIEKEKYIVKQNQNIEDLEAKLSDVKDFLFKNCSDKLEEFTLYYK